MLLIRVVADLDGRCLFLISDCGYLFFYKNFDELKFNLFY